MHPPKISIPPKMPRYKRKVVEKQPVKFIDTKQVFELAAIMCTNEEIAAVMEIDEMALRNHCAYELLMGRLVGRTSIRRAQYKAALDGNPTMLIWLGKQLLGQKEPKPEDSDKDLKQINVLQHPNVIPT